MIHAWSVDTISSLGASKGLGSVGYGTMRVVQPDGTIIEKGEDEIQRGDVPAEMPDEPTTFSSEGVSIEEVSLEIGDTEKPEALTVPPFVLTQYSVALLSERGFA